MKVSMKLQKSVLLPDGSSVRNGIVGDLDPVTGVLLLAEEQPGGRKIRPGTFIHLGSGCSGVRLDPPALAPGDVPALKVPKKPTTAA